MKRWIHAKEDFVVDWDLSKDPKLSKKMKRYEQMGIGDEEDAYDRAHKEGKYSERPVKGAVSPWKVKYEVHWISPEGKDCLLGGSDDINEANDIAIKQAREIFESPWESDERKYKFLDSMYIVDTDAWTKNLGYSTDAMLYQAEDVIENLMSELDSRIRK